VKPEILAEGPNQVWPWEATKLLASRKWSYFYLYVSNGVGLGLAPELVVEARHRRPFSEAPAGLGHDGVIEGRCLRWQDALQSIPMR
jgi:hypothetical protein